MKTRCRSAIAVVAATCACALLLAGCGNSSTASNSTADSSAAEQSLDRTDPVAVAKQYLQYLADGNMSAANKLLHSPLKEEQLLPDADYQKATGRISNIQVGSSVTEHSGDKGDFVPATYTINGKTKNYDGGVWVTNYKTANGEYSVSSYSEPALTGHSSSMIVQWCNPSIALIPGTMTVPCSTQYGDVSFTATTNSFGHNMGTTPSDEKIDTTNSKLLEATKAGIDEVLMNSLPVCPSGTGENFTECGSTEDNAIVEEPQVVGYEIQDGSLYIATTAAMSMNFNGTQKDVTVGTTDDPAWYLIGDSPGGLDSGLIPAFKDKDGKLTKSYVGCWRIQED